MLPIVANTATLSVLGACYFFPRLYLRHRVSFISCARGVCTINTVIIASGLLRLVMSAHLGPSAMAVALLVACTLFKAVFLVVSALAASAIFRL